MAVLTLQATAVRSCVDFVCAGRADSASYSNGGAVQWAACHIQYPVQCGWEHTAASPGHSSSAASFREGQ